MTDERYTFESTRTRLDEILVAVRRKDTSLEQSLELLEEGVRLANLCNELIDQTSWKLETPGGDDAEAAEGIAAEGPDASPDAAGSETADDAPATDSGEASGLEDDERD